MKLKVVLIGKFAAGKTSLISRYVDDQFSDEYLTTIGVKISTKKISTESQNYDFVVWDIQGKSSIMDFPQNYLVGVDKCILVGDLMRPDSLLELNEYSEMVKKLSKDVDCIVALNKKDLITSASDLENITAEFLSTNTYPYFFTSAKTAENVDALFRALVGDVL